MELSWWTQHGLFCKTALLLLVLGGLPMFFLHQQLSRCTSTLVDRPLPCRPAVNGAMRIWTGPRDRDIDIITSKDSPQANHQSLLPEPHCYGWHGLDLKTKDIGLLIAVKTAPERGEMRQKLRERWAERCLNGELRLPVSNTDVPGGSRVKCVFVVGQLKGGDEKSLKKLLEKEKGDIVVAPMADIYETMTSKTMWTLQWSLRTYCYRHLLFVDDDTHIFFSRLLPYTSVTGSKHQVGFYLGHSHWGFDVIHCSVDPGNKNCVDPKIYPRKKYFPYASGFAYLMSRDVVEKAVQMALIHVSQPLTLPGNSEDSMIGEVLHEANVPLTHHAGFVHWGLGIERCPMMVRHNSPVLVVGNAPDDILDRFAKNEKLDKPLCTGV